MSNRPVPRFALAGLLAAALAAPTFAQPIIVHSEEEIQSVEPRPQAPVPRPKALGTEFEFRFSAPKGFGLEITCASDCPRTTRVTHETAALQPCCEVGCCEPECCELGCTKPCAETGCCKSLSKDFAYHIIRTRFSTIGSFPVDEPVTGCCKPLAAAVSQECGQFGAKMLSAALKPRRPDLRIYAQYEVPGLGTKLCVEGPCCEVASGELVMPIPVPPQFAVPTGSFITGACGSFRPATTGGICAGVGPACYNQPAVGGMIFQFAAPTVAPTTVIPAGVIEVCPPCPFPTVAPNPLLGTWYRVMSDRVVSVTFTHDEMKVCITQAADSGIRSGTMTAHYTLTKDGLVYGAFTGADADMDKSSDSLGDGHLSFTTQKIVDAPFSFRIKSTSVGLMVSWLKCEAYGLSADEMFGGMFKSAKGGSVPTPKVLESTRAGSNCVGAAIRAAVGVPTTSSAPVMSAPLPPSSSYNVPQCSPPSCGTAPIGVPLRPARKIDSSDSGKAMATEAFGQLLQQSGFADGGMTLPACPYPVQGQQYFVPPAPAFTPLRDLRAQDEPVPQMPVPTPPVMAEEGATPPPMPVKPGKKMKKKKARDSNDVPLTPERIHGGIY